MQNLVVNKMKKLPRRLVINTLVCGLVVGLMGVMPVQAQNSKPPAQPAQTKEKPEAAPNPVKLTLSTKDGVKLRCTYFGRPDSEKGKEGKSVVPFILLHDWEGNRQQLYQYGGFLQSLGHAAIIPDLRGHGESVIVEGRDKPISFDKFRKSDIPSALKDIERCKKYLVKKHNEERVNIDMLSIVAVGKSSVLAVNWTWSDWWAFPPVNAQGIKQGQDVKALLLVAPRKKLAGLSMVDSLKHPMFTGANGDGLPLMILWGTEDENAQKDSERLHLALKKIRPDFSKIEDRAQRFEKETLFGSPIKGSSLSGAELMATPVVDGLWQYTEDFFARKVSDKAKEYVWKTRKTETAEEDD